MYFIKEVLLIKKRKKSAEFIPDEKRRDSINYKLRRTEKGFLKIKDK
jgi:hypothetical protein